VSSLFSRTTVKFVAEAQDWRAVSAALMRLCVLTSVGVMLVLVVVADPLATLFHEPRLTGYLRLFALEIPLFVLAQAHRNILVGIGGLRERALTSAGRWISRLVLIVLLVQMGLSVTGAIIGSIAASVVELFIARLYVRPSLWGRVSVPLRSPWAYGVPLLFAALSLRLLDILDLVLLKVLGASTAQAGFYGAAQSLSLVPRIFALSFSPILLSTLTRLARGGDADAMRKMGRDAMRLVLGFLPFAALAAGAAQEIVRFIFGQPFLPAAPLLALLIFGSVPLLMVSVASAILIAADRPGETLAVAGPLVPLAVVGCILLVPARGPQGAALATVLTATVGALASILAVRRVADIHLSMATLLRSVLLSALAYIAAVAWPADGMLLLVKLPAISLLIFFAYLVLGEFSTAEITVLRSMRDWRGTSRDAVLEAE
jgi:O-antigen/teichoic acid export membrane protein